MGGETIRFSSLVGLELRVLHKCDSIEGASDEKCHEDLSIECPGKGSFLSNNPVHLFLVFLFLILFALRFGFTVV